MRNFLFIFFLFPVFGWAAGSAGVMNGGGGGGTHSSPGDVKAVMDNSLYFPGVLERISNGISGGVALPIADVKARPIFEKILKLKNIVKCSGAPNEADCLDPIFNKFFPFELKMDAPCYESGQAKDASVHFHVSTGGEPVVDKLCLSAQGLARYPKEDLETQIVGLILHEFTHVAGFGEDDANYIQDYMVNRLLKPCRIGISVNAISPKAKTEDFTIEIRDGDFVTVEYERTLDFYRSYLRTSYGNDEDHSKPRTFKFNPQLFRGEIRFTSLNLDGSLSQNIVSWTKLDDQANPGIWWTSDIAASDIMIDSLPHTATHIGMTNSCIR